MKLARCQGVFEMSRLIFIAIIFVLVYWLLKSYSRQPPPKGGSPGAQDMVSCAHCGVHLPKNESVHVEGQYYCCIAHSHGETEK
jgi:uncharacterized protein